MRQLLQSVTILLQSATGITKCDDYYKVRQYTLCFISDEKSFSGLLTVDNTLPHIYHQTFPTHQEVERTILQPGGGVGSPYRSGSAPRRLRVLQSPLAVLLPLGANRI